MRTLRLPDPFPRGRPREKLEIGTSAWAADSCLVEWSNLEREWLEPEPTRARRATTWGSLLGDLAWKLQSLLLDALLRTVLKLALSALAGAAAAFVAGVLIAFCGLFFAGDGYGFLATEAFNVDQHGIHLSIGDTILIVTAVLGTAATWRLLSSRR
jgi:hypothetical protein